MHVPGPEAHNSLASSSSSSSSCSSSSSLSRRRKECERTAKCSYRRGRNYFDDPAAPRICVYKCMSEECYSVSSHSPHPPAHWVAMIAEPKADPQSFRPRPRDERRCMGMMNSRTEKSMRSGTASSSRASRDVQGTGFKQPGTGGKSLGGATGTKKTHGEGEPRERSKFNLRNNHQRGRISTFRRTCDHRPRAADGGRHEKHRHV
jgi:hypothetical protein